MKPPTPAQIAAEITELKRLKDLIPPTTLFGESNLDAITAEITALERGWDEDDAEDEYPTSPEGVIDQIGEDAAGDEERIADENRRLVDCVCCVIQWREGESDEKPSDGWLPLVK